MLFFEYINTLGHNMCLACDGVLVACWQCALYQNG